METDGASSWSEKPVEASASRPDRQKRGETELVLTNTRIDTLFPHAPTTRDVGGGGGAHASELAGWPAG